MSKFKIYHLTETQIQGIANVVRHEQGTTEGRFAEASQIANLCELRYKGDPVKAVTSGWYASGRARYNAGTSDKVCIEIVRRVFNYGFRTLPKYIDEHDCLSDIKSVTQKGKGVKSDKSKWVPHETVIKNKMSSTYTFYAFPGGYKTGVDPFGYTSKANREKYGDFCYTVSEARSMPEPFTGTLPERFPDRGYFKVGDGYLSSRSYKAEIRAIQGFLNWALKDIDGSRKLSIDGLYGGHTRAMTRLFQETKGLDANGCFGRKCLSEAKKMI